MNDFADSLECAFAKKTLACDADYEFRKLDDYSAVLIQNSKCGPVFRCGCNSAGDCRTRIDPDHRQALACAENACKGNWGWTVSVPKIPDAFVPLTLATLQEPI